MLVDVREIIGKDEVTLGKKLAQLKKPFNNRIIGHGEERVDQLLANPLNFRLHPDNQQQALAGAIDDIGFIRSVTVNQRTGRVVDGHLRVTLAARSGVETLPVEYVDLDEAEEAQALLSLDPIAAMAGTDRDKLDELLANVQSEDERVQAMIAEIAEKELSSMKLDNYSILKSANSLASAVSVGSFAACKWNPQKSDDYKRFLEWKKSPSTNWNITNKMAEDLSKLIELWARGWRGFVITTPPQGASAGGEYPAGFLGKAVASMLGVDYVTMFGQWKMKRTAHHPMDKLFKNETPEIVCITEKPIIIVDDMVSSGTTAKSCLSALYPHPCWFFAWMNNQGRRKTNCTI